MKSRVLKLIALAMVFGPLTAVASGSISLSSGSNHQLYNLGKKVFHQKIACDTCTLSSIVETDTTTDMLKKIKSDEVFKSLDGKEQKAVVEYVERRFLN